MHANKDGAKSPHLKTALVTKQHQGKCSVCVLGMPLSISCVRSRVQPGQGCQGGAGQGAPRGLQGLRLHEGKRPRDHEGEHHPRGDPGRQVRPSAHPLPACTPSSMAYCLLPLPNQCCTVLSDSKFPMHHGRESMTVFLQMGLSDLEDPQLQPGGPQLVSEHHLCCNTGLRRPRRESYPTTRRRRLWPLPVQWLPWWPPSPLEATSGAR